MIFLQNRLHQSQNMEQQPLGNAEEEAVWLGCTTQGCKLLLLRVPWVTCDSSASSSRIPAGGLLIIMQKVTGETLQEKRNRERRELYEQKLVEWQSRLSVTEVLGQMESDAQGEPETESKRI
uniref:Uncharacterized protein n=1 Tax=Bubo bubo TaxID=30461 RepID=A0A8C0ES73_BUBBB